MVTEEPSEGDIQAARLLAVESKTGYERAAKDIFEGKGGNAYLVLSRLTLAVDRLIVLMEQQPTDPRWRG